MTQKSGNSEKKEDDKGGITIARVFLYIVFAMVVIKSPLWTNLIVFVLVAMYWIPRGFMKKGIAVFKDKQFGFLSAFVAGLSASREEQKEESNQSKNNAKVIKTPDVKKRPVNNEVPSLDDFDIPPPPPDWFHETELDDDSWNINNCWNQVV